MTIYFISFAVLLLIVIGMSIGVLRGRKPLTGSCGGVGAALGEDNYVCDMCGGDESKCETKQDEAKRARKEQLKKEVESLAYDANQK